ncbi:MAG: YabP/YqfC family sporulation protein [Oscillospiraceae bacterium]|nr:YabP/YqfC family sporulation protein [Oscillospiraceae bacterium]
MPNRQNRGSRQKAGLERIAERLGEELEMPKTSLPGTVHIEMSGNREAVVDGCRGVVEYNENVIRLNTGKLIVRFTGSCLMIRTLQLNQAIVCGNILSVDFTS